MSPGSDVFEPWPEPGPLLEYLRWRFGVAADALAGHRFWHRPGSRSLWIAAREMKPPPDLPLEAVGMVAFRQPPPRGFPTSAFLRRFGHAATANVYDLDTATALRLMHGEAVAVEPLDERGGPYVVRCPRAVIGRGWVRAGALRLDVPKVWRDQLMPLADTL